MSKPLVRYLVIDAVEDYEQVLTLDKSDKRYPPGGVLEWSDGPRAMFATRKDARAAIDRTHYFALAFGMTNFPKRTDCKIVAVREAQP